MAFGQEVLAILMLIASFIFAREVEGGAGPAKEAKVVEDVLGYLTSPGGIHVTSDKALAVWKFTIPVFIRVIIFVLNYAGLLGNSGDSPKSSKP